MGKQWITKYNNTKRGGLRGLGSLLFYRGTQGKCIKSVTTQTRFVRLLSCKFILPAQNDE